MRAISKYPTAFWVYIITLLLVVVFMVPLGTEVMLAGSHQHYIPLGQAFNRESLQIWLHSINDLLIGISYVAISTTLAYLAYKARNDIPFLWMFLAFGAFIITCGMTHFISLFTIWTPAYYLAGTMKLVTAVASVATAVTLPFLVPKAMELISITKNDRSQREKLERANVTLEHQKHDLETLNIAKDEFVSLASHQLRTPATSVKLNVGMLLEGYTGKLSAQQKDVLREAYDSNEEQLNLIHDLLNVARADSGKMQLEKTPTDLVQFMRRICNAQKIQASKKQQKIICHNRIGKKKLMIDPERLKMALDNIIENASKYSNPHTTIHVSLIHVEQGVQIRIEDEGVGIPKADLPKLFMKFSRIQNPLSTKVGGTGLGLYWAKRVVELHGGTIEAESELGKGSTFKITLKEGD